MKTNLTLLGHLECPNDQVEENNTLFIKAVLEHLTVGIKVLILRIGHLTFVSITLIKVLIRLNESNKSFDFKGIVHNFFIFGQDSYFG